jgi:HlyD family type I secretion membrane fusion protein
VSTLPEAERFDLDRSFPVMSAPLTMRAPRLLGVIAVLAAVGGFGVWATTVPLDSAVVAQGKVTLAGKRKLVQHLDGGIVTMFAIKDGDHVEEGDVLIEFDTLRPAARLAVVRIAYFGALAAEARLVAERDEAADIAFSPELVAEAANDAEIAAIVESQRQLFEARRNEAAGQVRILESRVGQLRESIRGFELERAASSDQLAMARDEQTTIEALYAKQYTTRARILAIKREVYQLEGAIGRLGTQIAGAEKEIGETELNLAQLRKKHMTEVLNELRETQAKVLDLREQYVAAKGELDRTIVRAPSSGTVFASQVHTVGGVVRGGETLLEIVPNDDQLVIEVQLRPQDVDEVAVGQPTEVRLSGFKQRTTPTLQGRVAFVSADTVSEPRSPEPYYLASIEVDAGELRHLGDQKLQPGMPAETMINTGHRTAMAYLLQPLSDSMNRAWREQ